MSSWYRVTLIVIDAIGLIFLAISPAPAFEALWSAVLSDWALPTSELHVSMFSFVEPAGLQLAAASALERDGKGLRLGFGYDDMVSAAFNSLNGSNTPLAISDRMFLLTTPCDKRFQFTLRITW
jgi:hypothetical protein